MSRKLPSCPFWFRPAAAFLWFALAGTLAWAQEESPPEEEEEPAKGADEKGVKQLVFIEQHLAEAGVIDGIESPYDVKVSPDGEHVYVASQRNDALSHFARDAANGSLSYQGFLGEAGIGENALDGARSLAFSPDGEFLYAVSMFSDSLVSLDRDAATGDISFLGAIYDGDPGVDGLDGGRSIVVSPDGMNLYVAAYDESKLSVFSRNSVTGAASFLGVYAEGDQGVEELTEPHALAISPDGKHLYVALWKNEIVVFRRDLANGLLTYESKLAYLQAENLGSSGTPRAIAISPDGAYVYLASWNSDSVSVFSRDETDGALSHQSDWRHSDAEVHHLDGPHAITVSSDGRFVYVAAFVSDAVTSFERDPETGELAYFQSVFAGTEDSWHLNGPISIGASPDGEHVYVGSSSGFHSVVSFRREVLVDSPEFVVQPIAQSIEEDEAAAFYALAQGEGVSYQWFRGAAALTGEVLPVLTLDAVAPGDDGAVFRVEASNAGGTVSSDEATLTILPPIVVQAPSDLTALGLSSGSARLAWTDASDNETHFEIQRRVPGGEFSPIATVLADETQYDDATLSASSTYFYRVRAKRNEAASLWSNDAVVESFADAPQAPVNLMVEAQTYNKVALRWSDRSAVEEGFRVYRRRDEAGGNWALLATVDKNATRYEDRSVSPQSTYAYRALAFNESGASDYSNSVVALTDSIPVDAITPVSRSIPSEAVTGYTVSVTSEKAWEAISAVDWLIVTSPAGGVGSGSQGVVYRSRLNESQDERIGKIVVGGLEHTVAQAGSPPFLRIVPERALVGAAGGTAFVNVQSNMEWSSSEESPWVSISSGQTGSNYGSVVLNVAANESFEARIAELRVNENVLQIEQAGVTPYLTLDANSDRFDAAGGSGAISVASNVDWNASVSAEWITISSADHGSGDGTLEIAVGANEGPESRTAELTVNDVALTLTQDGPLHSEVEAPEWVRITAKELGAELEWLDLADSELGYRLRRQIAGTERYLPVAELEANATSYFDRSAPRGASVTYQLVAFDALGESDPVEATSDRLPGANVTKVALRVEGSLWSDGVLAEIPLAGAGVVTLERRGFGSELGRLGFAQTYPVARYQLHTDAGRMKPLGEGSAIDWAAYFQFEAVAGAESFSPEAEGILYGAASEAAGGAYARGGRALGQLTSPQATIALGFEIEGEMELPVLIQGQGKSLGNDGASAVSVTLYRLAQDGPADAIAVNADWRAWQGPSAIDIDEALRQTNARAQLAAGGGEARMLLDLGQGRYLALLRGVNGSEGSALLEALDAR